MLTVNVIKMFWEIIDSNELFDLLILVLFIPLTLAVVLVDILISPFELIALIIYAIKKVFNR